MFDDLPQRFRPGLDVRGRHGDAALLNLGGQLLRADPLADQAMAALAALPPGQGFACLERVLGGQPPPDAPGAVLDLVAAAADLPAWVDWEAVDRGGAVFLRAGLAAGVVLGMNSLLLGYASPGGNKPLVFSGRMREQTSRRLAETTRFVQAVSRPGGMRPGGDGFAITVKVRVMHAQVRRLIGETGRWQTSLWGEPINQHDMLATMLLFSVAALMGLRRLGYHVTDGEAEDVVHLWRVVGHVIGVDARLLPSTHAQALALAMMIRDTQGVPDDDGRALAKALFDARAATATTARERRQAEWRTKVMQGIARTLLGDDLADQLAIPRSLWSNAGAALRPALGLAARVNRLPVWRDLATQLGDRYWTAAVAFGLSGEPARFAPPSRVTEP